MIVTALVGPSGSGKSYRAIMVAHQQNLDLIIDDGLLIRNNQIVTGYSAKQQPTRIGAIKTALFQDAIHQQEARSWISSHQPNSVLILGTSLGMIKKIATHLALPVPNKIIKIEEIASAGEIETALYQRNMHGNHIIPVPMAEVKQKVPTKLIRSLQVLFASQPPARTKPIWADQTIIRPNFTGYGSFFIAETAIIKMIEMFFATAYPKYKLKHLNLNSKPSGIELEINLAVPYGLPIHTKLHEVKSKLQQKLFDFTGIQVLRLNLVAIELIL